MADGTDFLFYAALLAGIVLLLIGLALCGIWLVSSPGHGLSGRLRQLSLDYGGAGPQSDASAGLPGNQSLREVLVSGLETAALALGGFNMIGEKQRAKFHDLLVNAGIRRADGLRLLVTIKVISILGGTVAAVLCAIAGGVPTRGLVVAVLAGALAGSLMPEKVLASRAKSRQLRIAQRLPDALDLLIIFANAGYGLDQAIKQLSVDMRRSSPDLSDELAVTSDELRLLSDRNQALENFAARTGLAPVRVLVSALIQAQKYGTPLSQALRILAGELRSAHILEIEEKAARMPVLITVPLILLILPALFLVVATPAYIQVKHVWPTQNGAAPSPRR